MDGPDSPSFSYKVGSDRPSVIDCPQKKRRRRPVDLNNTRQTNERAKDVNIIHLETSIRLYHCFSFRRTSALNVTYLLSDTANGCSFDGTMTASIDDSFAGEGLFLVLDNCFEDLRTEIEEGFFLILGGCFVFVCFLYFLIKSGAKRFLILV